MLSSGIVSPDLAMQLEEYARNLLPPSARVNEKTLAQQEKERRLAGT